MFYYVYILQSLKDKSLYIGYTTDLRKRLKEHNSGKSLATKPYIPYQLIFYEAFLNRKDAKSREIYLKTGWGFRSINKMLKNYCTHSWMDTMTGSEPVGEGSIPSGCTTYKIEDFYVVRNV